MPDQEALEKQVAGMAGGLKKDNPAAYVACPLSVVVKEGAQFDCTVYVEITSEGVDISMSTSR